MGLVQVMTAVSFKTQVADNQEKTLSQTTDTFNGGIALFRGWVHKITHFMRNYALEILSNEGQFRLGTLR